MKSFRHSSNLNLPLEHPKTSKVLKNCELRSLTKNLLYVRGFIPDKDQIQVIISSMSCGTCFQDIHVADLAETIKLAIKRPGNDAFLCSTTEWVRLGSMLSSLKFRDLTTDLIETLMNLQMCDANISIPTFDNDIAACLIAMGRIEKPSFIIYGGVMNSAHYLVDKHVDVISAFNTHSAHAARAVIVCHSWTMISFDKTLCIDSMLRRVSLSGMSLPYSSSIYINGILKFDECRMAAKALLILLDKNLIPRDIMSEKAFENAMVLLFALVGSNSSIIHLIDVAGSVDIPITIDDFQNKSKCVALLTRLTTQGNFWMECLFKVGGTPAVLKYLLNKRLIHGDCMTVTGLTLQNNIFNCSPLVERQHIIMTREI